ncbi:MAG TPA: OmpA family protein [Candidatus Limnocylindrales bacterium]|nr:OmpA family protein [Candidatus Limnocylindrales bacterium]
MRFKEPEVLFDQGKAELKEKFKVILDDFFPRYIKLLFTKYKDNIEEIRIEGHTSSEWMEYKIDPETAYFKNMELSQDRTRSVLIYVLQMIKDDTLKQWARDKITANGLSSSKLIIKPNGEEDKEASRRVEFRVRTDAESQIGKILAQQERAK